MFLTFFGIQVIESSHHHESTKLQEACAICQVAAHHPFDVVPVATAPMAKVLFLLFILPLRRQTLLIAAAPCASYYSRAPPNSAA